MIDLINKIPWIDNILYGMLLVGAILCLYAVLLIGAGQGGKSDKRFRTGRKNNDLGDDDKQGKGCLVAIAGALLWVLVWWLVKIGIAPNSGI